MAVSGDPPKEVPIEPGSVVYVPKGAFHGVRNTDPNNRMEVVLITTPSAEGGLADFFRKATSKPGHPPLNLPMDQFMGLLHQYGMTVPPPPPAKSGK
jgi:hypothetical protein